MTEEITLSRGIAFAGAGTNVVILLTLFSGAGGGSFAVELRLVAILVSVSLPCLLLASIFTDMLLRADQAERIKLRGHYITKIFVWSFAIGGLTLFLSLIVI